MPLTSQLLYNASNLSDRPFLQVPLLVVYLRPPSLAPAQARARLPCPYPLLYAPGRSIYERGDVGGGGGGGGGTPWESPVA